MDIRKNLVSSSKYGTKCPYTMNPEFITVHNTYNDATAENEVAYMIRNDNQVSFHIAIDEKEAVQGIPLERNAWACGDGNGPGNRRSISVEICYSLSGGDRYYKAENNAAVVVAQLMKQYNIPISKVLTHQSWSGKYCPHRMLAEGRWDSFIERVKRAYNGNSAPSESNGGGNNSSPQEPSNGEVLGYLTTIAETANIRKEPNLNSPVMRQAVKKQGHTYYDWSYDGSHFWYKVAENNWMRDDVASINKDGKSKGVVWVSGTNINLRKGASTGDLVINKLSKQSAYDVHHRYENWIYVTGEGVEGWMYFDESYVKWIR
ncbi:N-acetylmuramoyl-L-alanine amidase [Bacillus wiedmannii]|uniref:N-acetylmuramoyl-L-alanine amidase n=1 Tax=Bacillus wiedmannii TaxID=1890302 RepID=UPI001CBA8BA5|nr:N-acetylmuramoyl-L-alanine amidase [Bacillus wiedmannii]MBZ4223082.1 N-acetylmuramoyl-L-alanine amidase [Bacillus wiedmannii]